MHLLTTNAVIRFIGNVERGTFPEADPSRELYKITSRDGNIFYAVPEGFVLYHEENVPDEIIPTKYCYTEEKGFYLNPNWDEFLPYGPDYKQGYEQALLDIMGK